MEGGDQREAIGAFEVGSTRGADVEQVDQLGVVIVVIPGELR